MKFREWRMTGHVKKCTGSALAKKIHSKGKNWKRKLEYAGFTSPVTRSH